MSIIEDTSGTGAEQGVVSGVSVGIVTANDDARGRVKLTFPWHESQDESDWARIATLMAGPDRGTFFVPEVGDEVLVAFEQGDIQYPYVIGALWNGEDKPPVDNAAKKNDVRSVKSRSGHEMRFDDADGAESVEIRTAGGHRISLDDTDGSERITIEDKTGSNRLSFDATTNAIELAAAGTISVNAPVLEFTADGNVTVEAGGVLTLKGGMVMIN